jgi:hypothetical protein
MTFSIWTLLVTKWAPLIAERVFKQAFYHSIELDGLRSFLCPVFPSRSQGTGVDAEDLRRTLLAVDNPAGFIQSPQDVIALRVLKRLCR